MSDIPARQKLRIMMIGAHPDDCDFRCGGIAFKYTRLGHQVQFVSLSDGSGGHQTLQPEQLAVRRRREAEKAARLAGIDYLVLDNKDCEIVADLAARQQVIRLIRQFQPDLILTSRINDYHADHRNTGILIQDASYLLIVPNTCVDVPAMTDMPVIGFFYDRFQNPPFEPEIVIDIDDVIDEKFQMLDCHESQVYEWLPFTNHQLAEVPNDPAGRMRWLRSPRISPAAAGGDESLREKRAGIFGESRMAEPARLYRQRLLERYGDEHGSQVVFAEAFQLSEYGRQPDQAELARLFPF